MATGRTPRIAAARRSGVTDSLRRGLAFRGGYSPRRVKQVDTVDTVDTVDRSGQKWT